MVIGLPRNEAAAVASEEDEEAEEEEEEEEEMEDTSEGDTEVGTVDATAGAALLFWEN